MFFIAYTFKGQVHLFAVRVKIVSHSSSRTSAIFKYFCPLKGYGIPGSPLPGSHLSHMLKFKIISFTLYMLDNFSCFCCRLLTFFKINFFQRKFFQKHYQTVKRFESRLGPTNGSMGLYCSLELLASWLYGIFLLIFFYYESMEANDPLGETNLDPWGMVDRVYLGGYIGEH